MRDKSTDQPAGLLSDEELHHRIVARPEFQAAYEEALAWLADPSRRTRPGITTEEELREFLREHG